MREAPSDVLHPSLVNFHRSKLLTLVFISARCFLWRPRPLRSSFNQLGGRRTAKGVPIRKKGAWLRVPNAVALNGAVLWAWLNPPKAVLRAGRWAWSKSSTAGRGQGMNAVIHKNCELLHSKEDLASGCLFIYV